MKTKTKRRKQKKRNIYDVLIALSVAVFIISGSVLIRELYTRRQGQSYYAAALSGVTPRLSAERLMPPRTVPGASADTAEAASAAASTTPDVSGVHGAPAADAGTVEAKADDWVPILDFEALRAEMPDIAAWIYCPGTVINYPVVHGDNNEFYMNHLPDGGGNKMGSIFLDYRSAPDFSGKNSVIYGHHMSSGDMFGQLEQYKNQAFYDAHPGFMLFTDERDYYVEIFAGYVADAAKETLPVNFAGADAFAGYIDEVRRRSVFSSGVEVSADGRLVTLCTCTYNFNTARFIIVGKLTEV